MTSKDNPNIRELTALLQHKKAREETQRFAIEGARLCAEAVLAKIPIEKVFVTRDAFLRYPKETKSLVETAQAVYEIPQTIARGVADTKSPQGLFAICRKLDNSLNPITIKSDGLYLVLCNLQEPGNVGTILRTAFAFGISSVFLTEDCAELYAPKVVRASMGAIFQLSICIVPSFGELSQAFCRAKVPIFATALHRNALPLDAKLFRKGGAVVFGNEGCGLPKYIIDQCDHIVTIPMAQDAESLNVSIAAGVVAWEMQKHKK